MRAVQSLAPQQAADLTRRLALPSAFSMTDSLYAAVKRRLVAFAVTSGSGAAAALRLPSSEEGGAPFVFIPSPRPIVLSPCLALL